MPATSTNERWANIGIREASAGAVLVTADTPTQVYAWYRERLLAEKWTPYPVALLSTQLTAQGYPLSTALVHAVPRSGWEVRSAATTVPPMSTALMASSCQSRGTRLMGTASALRGWG